MARKDRHILAREQRLGAIVLLVIALAVWLFFAFYHAEKPATSPEKPETKKSWAERQDSIRLADSLRFAQWQEKREARYDSVKQALAVRHEAYKAELQQWYDSTHIADSLWRDSIGIRFVKKIKKDTILDLNHCDTAELQLIRGIGRYTAVQIVKYRKQLGGYYSPEQLTDEPFAKLSLDTLLHHFTANSSDVQLLRINSCSVETLARHPYLRYEQAKAIYTLRRKRVRLNTINDLRALPELPDSTLSRLAPYLSFE
ncbi:MAG: helix-hairpin-helix domain-containing protein [Paludibacteraceae bacterium]|nr:helix-hairpin-helix domain-containing protein [Paludibacteraceae bacterium]